MTMEREAFLYVKAKLRNSSFENRMNFGSGEVHFYLTGTYMNDPYWFLLKPMHRISVRLTRPHPTMSPHFDDFQPIASMGVRRPKATAKLGVVINWTLNTIHRTQGPVLRKHSPAAVPSYPRPTRTRFRSRPDL